MLPGSRISDAHIKHSLVNDGALVHADRVENSILGIRSVVREHSEIFDSYIMGNDFFETDHKDKIPLGIGKHCLIKNAIVDKNVRIGDNVQIINKDNVENDETDTYCIRDGIVVVKKGVVIPDGTVI
jgi:glucose-1-phosphate adenylyltransferase